MNQIQFPSYQDYDDDYERYLQILKEGQVVEGVSKEEAIQYVLANQITSGLINFTLKYIKSQLTNTASAETYYVKRIEEFEPIMRRLQTFAIIIFQSQQTINGVLWDTLQKRILLINRNYEIETLYQDQEVIKIDVFNKDLLSPIAGIFIRAVNYNNLKLNFNQCMNQQLIKWALLKTYRQRQLKDEGQSYSRILDNELLEEVNKSRPQQPSRKSSNKSFQQPQLNSRSYVSEPQNSYPSFQQPISNKSQTHDITHLSLKSASKIDNLKDQITQREFTQVLENIKEEILNNQADDDLKPRDYMLKPVVPYFKPDQVINLPIDSLEKMLQEQVQKIKPAEPNPQEKLQQLLMYYYQHNPQQYKILLGQYSELIHEQMFSNMGLPTSKKKPKADISFLSQPKSNVAKSQVLQPASFSSQLFQPKLQAQQPIQEEIVAKKYNRRINKFEVEQLKTKLILTTNAMEFYFSYLSEECRRVLIMPLEFYNVLSQSNYDKASSFTNTYQGKNRTIFDLFDKLFVPIQISQYEFIGIYVDFHQKTMYLINTLERKDRKQPPYKEILDLPTMHFVSKFIENEYNHKVMRAFNILNWQFVELRNEFAKNFNHSAIVLAFVFDQICYHKPVSGDDQNQQLRDFAQKVLTVIRKSGITKQ